MKNFTVLIKESFEIHKQKIKPILALATILITLEIILSSSLGYLLGMGEMGDVANITGTFLVFSYLSIGIIPLAIICSMFIIFSFLILTVKPSGTGLKEILQEAWKKFWQYFLIIILTSFFIILSSIFLIIPGIIVAVYLGFSPYAFIAEGKRGINSLKRSWNLIKGSWWKVFGRLILLSIFFGIISVILSSINLILSPTFPLTFLYAILLHFVNFFYIMPLIMIFLYLIYSDLKKSKEIQVQTQTQV